jgi:hypothetical protein
MIRPEASARLAQYREALIGLGVLCLGLYWAFFTGGGLLHWIGYGVAALGAVLTFAGWQRARFARGKDGPGIVRVVEGRITYFGPLSGGAADLEALSLLSLDPSARPAHWILHQPGQPVLAIPTTAEGADTLFDAFSHLPGIRTEAMLRALERGGDQTIVIWRSPDAQRSTPRLH